MARILVAEDSQYIQYLLKRVLSAQGHQVYSAKEGYEALEALERYSIELLLIDLHLPGVDGIQLIDRLHLKRRKMPFIVVSGYLDADTERRLMKRGAARIFAKPVEQDLLAQGVQEVLQPARRVLVVTEDPPLVKPLQEQMEQLGYQVEVQWLLESVEAQVVHRAFNALVLWGQWVGGRSGMEICRRLRAQEEWLPIFVPSTVVQGRPAGPLGLIPIPNDDPACDAFYTRLAGQIGLQRESHAGELVVIHLAGLIDREDVLAESLREAVAQRRNILFDLRQTAYLSPFVKKQLKELDLEAQQYHLDLGVLLGGSSAPLSVEQWGQGPDSCYRIFGTEAEARAALRPGGASKSAQGREHRSHD